MKNFSWKGNFFSNVSAQKVGEELEEIERNGNIAPEHIIEYADRHKDSELHKCFEWDNDEAGRKYRMWQARQIICSIELEIKEEPKETSRVYFKVKEKETDKKVFKSVKEVSKDDELYQQIVEEAKEKLIKYKENYENLLKRDDLKDIIFEVYKNV